MYQAVFNDEKYLMHFNKNHSSKNGQFTSGDGDGDGVADDHRNRSKNVNKGQGSGSGSSTSYKSSKGSKAASKGKDGDFKKPKMTSEQKQDTAAGLVSLFAMAPAMTFMSYKMAQDGESFAALLYGMSAGMWTATGIVSLGNARSSRQDQVRQAKREYNSKKN